MFSFRVVGCDTSKQNWVSVFQAKECFHSEWLVVTQVSRTGCLFSRLKSVFIQSDWL